MPLCLLMAPTASAETVTFTFRVPVELSELHPDVESVQVRCYFHKPGAGPIAGQPRAPVSSDPLPVNASGSVRTVVELATQVPARSAHSHDEYRCETYFFSKDGKRERAVRRRDARSKAHPSALPFYVVQDSSQIEVEGKRRPDLGRTLGTGGGVLQRAPR